VKVTAADNVLGPSGISTLTVAMPFSSVPEIALLIAVVRSPCCGVIVNSIVLPTGILLVANEILTGLGVASGITMSPAPVGLVGAVIPATSVILTAGIFAKNIGCGPVTMAAGIS